MVGQSYEPAVDLRDLALVLDEDPRVAAVMRVLQGEAVDDVATDVAVEPRILGHWLAQFVAGGRERLVHRDGPDTARSDRLLALVAHELRTPVSVVAGWLRVLGDHVTDDHAGSTALREVRSGTERLRRLVDDLLDTTAASLGRYRLTESRLDARDLVTLALAGDPHIDLALPDHAQPVTGDESGLVRVLQRLVLSARLGDTRAPLRATVSTVGPWVEVEVLRLGAQLPFDTVHAMLEPFDAPPDRPVASLGLYMARSVTVSHRGYLGARGTPAGTSFWIRLPRNAQDESS